MNTDPTTYAIRVDGHLDDHWASWLGELDMTRGEDGTTTLTVSVADQAQLHGVLAGLRDIGAVIIELRTTDEDQISYAEKGEHPRSWRFIQTPQPVSDRNTSTSTRSARTPANTSRQ